MEAEQRTTGMWSDPIQQYSAELKQMCETITHINSIPLTDKPLIEPKDNDKGPDGVTSATAIDLEKPTTLSDSVFTDEWEAIIKQYRDAFESHFMGLYDEDPAPEQGTTVKHFIGSTPHASVEVVISMNGTVTVNVRVRKTVAFPELDEEADEGEAPLLFSTTREEGVPSGVEVAMYCARLIQAQYIRREQSVAKGVDKWAGDSDGDGMTIRQSDWAEMTGRSRKTVWSNQQD